MAYRLDENFSAGPSRTSLDLYSPDQTNSRAVSAAMRALQDRIRLLEAENEHLTRSLRLSEDRVVQEAALWKNKQEDSLQTEKILRNRVRELEDEIRNIKISLQNAIEQVRILENQMRVNQTETYRSTEQCKLDKEAWVLEKERLEKALEARTGSERQLKSRVTALEAREKAMIEEMRSVQAVKRELEGEVKYLRTNQAKETKSLQKTLAEVETDLKSQNAELSGRVQTLQAKNSKLTELANRRKEEADYVKKEIQTIRASSSPRKRSPPSQHHSRKSSGRPPLSERTHTPQPRPENRHIGAHLTPSHSESNVHIPKSQVLEESQLNRRIQQIEAELDEDSWKYQSLLQQSQDSKTDLGALRTEMDALADEMDTKTSKLLRLKKEHNEAARLRLGKTR